jgi:hypothetical protein
MKALGGEDAKTLPDRLLRYVAGRAPHEAEQAALVKAAVATKEDAPRRMLAMAIASPAFQRY